jgi:hypothetical protein
VHLNVTVTLFVWVLGEVRGNYGPGRIQQTQMIQIQQVHTVNFIIVGRIHPIILYLLQKVKQIIQIMVQRVDLRDITRRLHRIVLTQIRGHLRVQISVHDNLRLHNKLSPVEQHARVQQWRVQTIRGNVVRVYLQVHMLVAVVLLTLVPGVNLRAIPHTMEQTVRTGAHELVVGV